MTSALDPRIGMLASGRYYCFPRGYHQAEVVGTVEEVEAALGLRDTKPHPTPKRLRQYEVTVSPTVVVYAGNWRGGPYTVEVSAPSRAQAIAKARRDRQELEGHQAVRADYSAKLKP